VTNLTQAAKMTVIAETEKSYESKAVKTNKVVFVSIKKTE